MEKAADVRLARNGRDYISCDVGRFKGPEADAAVGREGGERVHKFWKALPVRSVEREVATRHDDFVVADVYKALRLVENCVEINGRRLAPELGDYAEGAFPGAAVLHLEIGAGCPRGDGRAAWRLAKGGGSVLHGDFLRAACDKTPFDKNPLVRIFVPDVRDELLAVALGASRHRAAAHYYDVGVGMAACKFPPASEILGLLVKRLRAVQPAAERLEANFHGRNYTIFCGLARSWRKPRNHDMV